MRPGLRRLRCQAQADDDQKVAKAALLCADPGHGGHARGFLRPSNAGALEVRAWLGSSLMRS